MLKVELLKYPLTMSQVDKLIIFMVYYDIKTIEELLSKDESELSQMEGWTEELKETKAIVHGNYPLN
ncbi:hypothetical protein [Brumimicrobium aurantiacum]|uniref:Uncharacterized protein n=1 Tax=Brumimicrobium aurantiacum TaxID=1737063 RepID=A0A3E1EUG8_9FLAO|nr:hypothetical protein [Brumimicrobium aurantiacum]RFC53195.1 hypothetical protein DXU93_14090 [Brumimicrobium aurantiacum]